MTKPELLWRPASQDEQKLILERLAQFRGKQPPRDSKTLILDGYGNDNKLVDSHQLLLASLANFLLFDRRRTLGVAVATAHTQRADYGICVILRGPSVISTFNDEIIVRANKIIQETGGNLLVPQFPDELIR